MGNSKCLVNIVSKDARLKAIRCAVDLVDRALDVPIGSDRSNRAKYLIANAGHLTVNFHKYRGRIEVFTDSLAAVYTFCAHINRSLYVTMDAFSGAFSNKRS